MRTYACRKIGLKPRNGNPKENFLLKSICLAINVCSILNPLYLFEFVFLLLINAFDSVQLNGMSKVWRLWFCCVAAWKLDVQLCVFVAFATKCSLQMHSFDDNKLSLYSYRAIFMLSTTIYAYIFAAALMQTQHVSLQCGRFAWPFSFKIFDRTHCKLTMFYDVILCWPFRFYFFPACLALFQFA